MIGIDTNVLLRYLMQDDPVQAKRANKVFEQEVSEEFPAFISAIVLVETCWTLKRFYKIERGQILEMLDQLLIASELKLEHREEVWRALQQARRGHIDFVDALIGSIGLSKGCDFTFTFDKKASKGEGFKKI